MDSYFLPDNRKIPMPLSVVDTVPLYLKWMQANSFVNYFDMEEDVVVPGGSFCLGSALVLNKAGST